MKKHGKLLLKISISALLLAVLFLRVDKNILIKNLSLLDFRFAPFIVLFLALNYLFSSIRWKRLLIYENTSGVSVWYLTSLYFIGSFFNNFMPTSIGGDVYKVYRLGKKIGNTPNALSATFMERFTGVIVLALISIFGLIRYLGALTLIPFVLFILGMFFGLWLLKVLGDRFAKLKEIYESLMKYKKQYSVLTFALVTSIIVQLMTILTQYFVFLSIGVRLPFFYSLLVFPVIVLASFFIPSLNGVGVQDALYVSMFSVVGVRPETALSASILFHLFRLTVSLIGGGFYAANKDE